MLFDFIEAVQVQLGGVDIKRGTQTHGDAVTANTRGGQKLVDKELPILTDSVSWNGVSGYEVGAVTVMVAVAVCIQHDGGRCFAMQYFGMFCQFGIHRNL